jgi:hypothetical protein
MNEHISEETKSPACINGAMFEQKSHNVWELMSINPIKKNTITIN